MFKVGDTLLKIKAAEGFEDTVGDRGVILKVLPFNKAYVLEIIEGSTLFKGQDYFMSETQNWIIDNLSLENK